VTSLLVAPPTSRRARAEKPTTIAEDLERERRTDRHHGSVERVRHWDDADAEETTDAEGVDRKPQIRDERRRSRLRRCEQRRLHRAAGSTSARARRREKRAPSDNQASRDQPFFGILRVGGLLEPGVRERILGAGSPCAGSSRRRADHRAVDDVLRMSDQAARTFVSSRLS
jgi:hypothetical protein